MAGIADDSGWIESRRGLPPQVGFNAMTCHAFERRGQQLNLRALTCGFDCCAGLHMIALWFYIHVWQNFVPFHGYQMLASH